MKKMLRGVLLLAITIPASVLATGNDELWEISTKVEMQGMPFEMPSITDKSCLPKGEANKPIQGKEDKNCTVSDVKVSGNTTKWKVRCTGKDAMEGSGEVTHTGDTLKGTIKMSSRDGDMKQTISGKRIGACNAATAKDDKIKEMIQGHKAGNCSETVDGIADSGGVDPITKGAPSGAAQMMEMVTIKESDFRKGGVCADHFPELCKKAQERVSTVEGYEAYIKNKGWVAAACKIDLNTKRAALCKESYKRLMDSPNGIERTEGGKQSFIGQNCPAEKAEVCNEAISKDKLSIVNAWCSDAKIAASCKKIAQKGDYDEIFYFGKGCSAEIRAAACKYEFGERKYHELSLGKEFCPTEVVAPECKKLMEAGNYYGVAVVEICPAEAIKPYCKNMAAKVDKEAFKVLAEYCPAEAKAVAKTHCEQWGRDYTSDNQMKACSPYYKYDDEQQSVKDKYNSEDKQAETEGIAGKGNKLMDKLFNRKPEEKTAAEGDAGERASKKEGASSGSKNKEAAAEKPASADNPVGNILDGAKKLKGLLNF